MGYKIKIDSFPQTNVSRSFQKWLRRAGLSLPHVLTSENESEVAAAFDAIAHSVSLDPKLMPRQSRQFSRLITARRRAYETIRQEVQDGAKASGSGSMKVFR